MIAVLGKGRRFLKIGFDLKLVQNLYQLTVFCFESGGKILRVRIVV